MLACATLLRLLNIGSLPTNDEAISGLAARGVVETGVPTLPSGVVYVRDPLYHYALGAVFALPGSDELAGRLLGIALSVAAVAGVHRLSLALFGSPAAAVGAALLAAVDPFSASYAARLRMYGALQAVVVWALVAFEHAFVGSAAGRAVETAHAAGTEEPPGRRRRHLSEARGPRDDGNPAPRAATLVALALFTAAYLVQKLAILLLPALGAVWLATSGWRRTGWRWVAPAALLAAVAFGSAFLLPELGELAPLQAVPGAQVSAPDLETSARTAYLETLRAKLPGRAASAARAGLLGLTLLAAAAGVLRSAAWRGPGLRLLAYLLVPTALTFLWPTGVFFDARYFLHLLPLAAVLLGSGVVGWLPGLGPPTPLVTAAATAASGCFLAWGTPLWRLRYPAFLLPFVAGLPSAARRSTAEASSVAAAPGEGRRAALARTLAWPSAAVAFALPLTGAALWWVPVLDFEPALRHAAARHEPADVVLADGHVPLVAWRLSDVDGAVPNFSLNVFRSGDRVLGDLYTAAPPVDTPAALAELADRRRVWWFDYAPADLDPAHAAFAAERLRPLRAYAARNFRRAVACGDVTLWDSRGEAGLTLGCDLRPLPQAEEP